MGGPEAADDGATRRLVNAFQLGNVGIIRAKHKLKRAGEKLCTKERSTPLREPMRKQRYRGKNWALRREK